MDIRTKLVIAFVAVSLASMLMFGWFAYGQGRERLRDSALRQLEAVAEGKKRDLGRVTQAWYDRVQLIASRTQLRVSLAAYVETGGAEDLERIRQILDDAGEAVSSVRAVTVYDAGGSLVARSGVNAEPNGTLDLSAFRGSDRSMTYEGLGRDEEGTLTISFLAPLRLDHRLIGAVQVVMSAWEFAELTQDSTVLGETGRIIVARKGRRGEAVVLNQPLPDGVTGSVTVRLEPGDPLLQAVEGIEAIFAEGAVNERGERIWAATRYLPDLGVGLVVEFGAEEEERPIRELRRTMVSLALSLSAFAIVAGTLLGFRIAKPIRDLAGVANRIRMGELNARAEAGSPDEVGLLAATFNEMAESLIAKNRELEQRLEEHVKEHHTGEFPVVETGEESPGGLS